MWIDRIYGKWRCGTLTFIVCNSYPNVIRSNLNLIWWKVACEDNGYTINSQAKQTAKAVCQYWNQWVNEVISWLTIAWKIFGYHGYTLKILFNVLMSLLDQFVVSSLRGWGEGLGLGKSWDFVNIYNGILT